MGDLNEYFSREEFACTIPSKAEDAMPIKKECPVCGNEFSTYPSINKLHCSRECSCAAVKAKTYEKYKCECSVCGVEFLPKRPAEGGTFCSYTCRGVADRKDRVDRNGYWYVCVPEHPNSSAQGYVPEHHLIMEEYIGRHIEHGEIVHHIDHDKKNNEIENLQLMTDSEHKALHARMSNRDKYGKMAAGSACKGVA